MNNCYDKAMEFVQLTIKMEELMNLKEKAKTVSESEKLDDRINALDIELHNIKRSLSKIEYKEV